jgi:hypothetical protein
VEDGERVGLAGSVPWTAFFWLVGGLAGWDGSAVVDD